MRRKSRHRSRRRSNPTVGTGTTLAVIGAVLAGGTLLYAGLANAAPAAPTPRPTTAPPAPAPPENPAATAAQPAVQEVPSPTADDRAPATVAPAPEPVDNPVQTNAATGAEERVFPDHIVAILGADTVVRSTATAGSPIVARLRAGQRVNVRATNNVAAARRRCGPTSGIVSVYGITVTGGRTVDGYACINTREIPTGTFMRIDGTTYSADIPALGA